MRMRLKDVFTDIDVWMSKYISLEQPLTTVDENLDCKVGPVEVYSAEEWKITRTKGYNKIGEDGIKISDNHKYLNHMICDDTRKLLAALSLVRNFDFQKYNSIFEIGCGEMIQAFIIKQYFPNIRYLVTDIDPYIIEKCSKLSLLSQIEKAIYNVMEDDPIIFDGFDLLISWGVEYAIDYDKLLKLLCSAKKYSVPFLMCTQQIIGPMRYMSRKIKTMSFNPQKMLEMGVRLHGWTRSLNYFKKLAKKSNMRFETPRSPSTQIGAEANYHWLLFKP